MMNAGVLIVKIECKLQDWKGKFISLGGTIILLNSSLSANGYLSTKVRRIDKLRCSCGMMVIQQRKKYASMRRNIVCRSTNQGGLRLLDLELMNKHC